MSFTHTITTQSNYSGADIGTLSAAFTSTQTAAAYVEVEETILDSTTDGLVAFTMDVSQLKLLVIKSDYEITIETNDGTNADDVLVITADTPIVWSTDSQLTCPLTTDVTALYVTNTASANDATLTIRALYDPTV